MNASRDWRHRFASAGACAVGLVDGGLSLIRHRATAGGAIVAELAGARGRPDRVERCVLPEPLATGGWLVPEVAVVTSLALPDLAPMRDRAGCLRPLWRLWLRLHPWDEYGRSIGFVIRPDCSKDRPGEYWYRRLQPIRASGHPARQIGRLRSPWLTIPRSAGPWSGSYVQTKDIRAAVQGRETEVSRRSESPGLTARTSHLPVPGSRGRAPFLALGRAQGQGVLHLHRSLALNLRCGDALRGHRLRSGQAARRRDPGPA